MSRCPGRPEIYLEGMDDSVGGECVNQGTHYPILVASNENGVVEIPLTDLYCRYCIDEVPNLPDWYEHPDEDDEDAVSEDWSVAQVTPAELFEREPSLYHKVSIWLESKGFTKIPERHQFGLRWEKRS